MKTKYIIDVERLNSFNISNECSLQVYHILLLQYIETEIFWEKELSEPVFLPYVFHCIDLQKIQENSVVLKLPIKYLKELIDDLVKCGLLEVNKEKFYRITSKYFYDLGENWKI